MKDENEDPWGPSKGVQKGQKLLRLTKILNFVYFMELEGFFR